MICSTCGGFTRGRVQNLPAARGTCKGKQTCRKPLNAAIFIRLPKYQPLYNCAKHKPKPDLIPSVLYSAVR